MANDIQWSFLHTFTSPPKFQTIRSTLNIPTDSCQAFKQPWNPKEPISPAANPPPKNSSKKQVCPRYNKIYNNYNS